MILTQDSRSTLVLKLQRELNLGGANMREDGDFGPITTCGLLQAQRKTNILEYSGICINVDGKYNTKDSYSFLKDGDLIPMSKYMTRHPVPYLTQRDNFNNPSGTCNVTCVAMMLAWNGKPFLIDKRQLEDVLFDQLRTPAANKHLAEVAPWAITSKTSPQLVLAMLEWLLKTNGLENASFSTVRTRTGVLNTLDSGPVLLSGKFTKSGHIVLAIGKTQDGDLIIHDPWGDWMRGYKKNINGNARVYPNEVIWDCLDKKNNGRCWSITV